jgi:hypothetical protein
LIRNEREQWIPLAHNQFNNPNAKVQALTFDVPLQIRSKNTIKIPILQQWQKMLEKSFKLHKTEG